MQFTLTCAVLSKTKNFHPSFELCAYPTDCVLPQIYYQCRVLAAPLIIEYVVKFAARSVKKMEQTESMKQYIPHLRYFTLEAGQIRLPQDMELGKSILRDPSVEQPDKDRLNEAFKRAAQIQHDIETNINIVLEKAEVFFSRKRKVALSKLDQQTRGLEFTLGSFHDMVISLTLLQASQSLLFLDDHEFVIIGPQENGRYLNSGTFITAGRLRRRHRAVHPKSRTSYLKPSRTRSTATLQSRGTYSC
jgi:hypothetical protein